MTKKVANNCSQEGGKGRQRSTWGPWSRGLWKVISTRYTRFKPPRSWSWRLKGLLTVVAKKEEKGDDDQHEDCDQEGHKQLQEMQA